jgi:transposase
MRLISEVPAVFLHGALRQLSASWNRHLKMTREGRPSGPPGFRSMRRGGSLYWQVQDVGGPCPVGKLITVTREGTRDRPARAVLRVPGPIGKVEIRYHRELPADAMVRFASLRVDDLGRYWVTMQYDTARVRQPASTGIVGVDVSVAVTAATSDGEVYHAPGLSPGQWQRRDRLQKAMARKRRLNPCRHDRFVTMRGRTRLVRGRCPPPGHPAHDCYCWKHSRRYARDKTDFLKLSQRAARQRTAASHLASRALADKYAIVVVEDLDVSSMTATAKGTESTHGRNVRAKAGLNRAILAQNWSQLRKFTAYKTQVIPVAAPKTSQECPQCGKVDPANRPERDLFRCVSCGLTGHADIVAAQNIKGRYAAPTAAAQSVAARETCLPVREQPANSNPNSTGTPQEQSGQAREISLLPTGNLVPQAWGKIGTRERAQRSGPRRLKR